MEHIKASSVSEAWRAAARIFPTDYEKNEENSKRAGYPIYETTSTDERFSGFHISDLNTRLEVNMGNETVTIWIEEDAFEIVVKGLTEEEKESLKEVVDKEIRRIKSTKREFCGNGFSTVRIVKRLKNGKLHILFSSTTSILNEGAEF